MPAAQPIRPRRRPLGGPTGGTAVVNRDPNMYYILVPENRYGQTYGVDHFKSMGYDLCRFSKDGAKLAGLAYSESIKPGDPQIWMGMALMQIPNELKADIDLHGLDGHGGTQMMEDIVATTVRQPKQRSRYVREVNETSEQVFEMEEA